MSNLLLDDLQRLTPSQGVLLHRLADLGYLTRDQVDVCWLSARSRNETMKLRELAIPYVVSEVDYGALQHFIEQVFAEKYGEATLLDVRVVHFNPEIIDATVLVKTRLPEMDTTALQLSDEFRREGLRVGIRVAQSPKKAADEHASS